MKYEELADTTNFPAILIFEGLEIRVVKAAYTEICNRRLQSGNSGSIDKWEEYIIDFDDQTKEMPVRPTSPEDVAAVLEEFGEKSEPESEEISRLPIPTFENAYAIRRRILGAKALELAEQIREAAYGPGLTEAEKEAVVEKFSTDLDVLDQGLPEN